MKWKIEIDNFLGGFAPAWYKEGYPSYGDKNHAGDMVSCDLTDPGGFKQGPGLANLTDGTQAGAVTTLISSIMDISVADRETYGIGGNQLYKITNTAVINTGAWPHTIDKAAVTSEIGSDVIEFQDALYYTYNHSGAAGDIGKYDLSSTFDDDWGSTVPSGAAALGGDAHPMIEGGNLLFIGNGRYVTTYDGTTLVPQALDLFPASMVITSLEWLGDKLWIGANSPNVTGSNKNRASIFVWDGTTEAWEAEIVIGGEIGGMYVKNGTLFLFYRDVSSFGGYKLAYVNGLNITDLANYPGSLPTQHQITEYKDFIIWNTSSVDSLWSVTSYPWQKTSPWTTTASDTIMAYGSGDKNLPVRLFNLADSGYAEGGALSCPFGTPLIASSEGTNYKLGYFSGFSTDANWKSLLFDVTGDDRMSEIERVKIRFDQLQTDARVDWAIKDSQGNTIHSDTISYDKLGAATKADYELAKQAEDFRLEFNYANGDTTNTVKVRGIKVIGNSE